MNKNSNLALASSIDPLGSFEERLAILQKCFPELNAVSKFDSKIITDSALSEGKEFYPFIAWRKVGENYVSAVKILIEKLLETGQFQVMFGESKLDGLVCNHNTVVKITQIFDRQLEYDVKVLSVQTDGRYSGRSVKSIMENLNQREEFPLYLFSVLLMLLVQPDILSSYRDKGIVCAGNSFTVGGIMYAPVLRRDESGALALDSLRIDNPTKFHSVATGFVLK